MGLDRFALGFDDLLGVLLVVRLLFLRLHKVYGIFCAVVLFQVAGSLVVMLAAYKPGLVDYRLSWLILAVVSWVLLLWLVYVFLGAVLATLPGVMRFSRRVLDISFVAAGAIAFLSSNRPIMSMFSGAYSLQAAVAVAFVIDRAVSATALLLLLAVLAFVLWFPVEMPKNLVMFSFGLGVYFTIQIGVILMRDIAPKIRPAYLSATATILSDLV